MRNKITIDRTEGKIKKKYEKKMAAQEAAMIY